MRSDIRSFGYDERLGLYYVQFVKGDKYLHYSPSNVDVATFSQQLEPPFRVTRNSDGEVLHKILGVRVYEGKFNKAYGVVFENGEIKDYPSDYLTIEEHIDDHRSINVWEYLNEVARYNVISIDDDKSVSLADKYSKMEFVATNSLLEAYLNIETYGTPPTTSPSAPIFPFGCNRSQYKAVRNALENKISVIQGPPGTGKTQTILNILANLILDGKTMEIVSNNNSAVENVKEKLAANGLDFICAQLGRASNKKVFVDSQTGAFPDIESWKLNNAKAVCKEAISLSRELQKLYKCQEKLAVCSELLTEYKRQVERFPKTEAPRKKWKTQTLEKYFLLTSREIERKHRLSWWTRLRLHFHRLPTTETAPDKIQYLLITAKIKEYEQKRKRYSDYVKGAEAKNKRLRDLSMLILKDHLYRKYGKRERKFFSIEDIHNKTIDFLKEYPVVLSTTFSATSNINHAYKFDYLIMDEASQVDIAAGALALSCAKNAVIVGDLKQLPNVVDTRTEEIVSAIFAKYGIDEAYKYSTNSFLSSLCTLYPQIPQTLLREHYRCDPLIIGFCSKQFYNGELIPMKKSESEFAPIRVVRTVKGNHARGTVNFRQVETITQEILPALEEQFTDIGIIAPYNNQVDALQAALQATGRNYVAATVHKFQGREDDAIVLSTVDNQIQEFTDDPHLLNVAVSRAKKQFTLVVSAEEQPDSNIRDLIDYIEYYQGKSEQSKISSIFDLLYKDYTQDLLNFYETHKRVSEYDSENLTYWAINDTIKEKGFPHLGILMHYPLRLLVTKASNLTSEQNEYASHSWTHVDFLIYDTVTHMAKLAIEVDGTQYHKAGSEQKHRDQMKDSILADIGLHFLRLSTAGSQEKEKISAELARCLK